MTHRVAGAAGFAFLSERAANSVFPVRSCGAMLAAMADAEALESLRNAIRMLFPAGPAREHWLAWADRIQDEGPRDIDQSCASGGCKSANARTQTIDPV
jgi:hypothetical protein